MGHHKHKVFAEAVSEMKHFLLGAALVLALVTVVPALAQTPPPGGDMGAPPAGGAPPPGGAPQGGAPQGQPQGGAPQGQPQGGAPQGQPQGGAPQGQPQGGQPQGGAPQGQPQGGQPQGGQQGGFQGGMQGGQPQGGQQGGFPGQGNGVEGGFPGQGKGVQGGFPGMQGDKQGGFQQGGMQQGGKQGGFQQGGMQQGGKQGGFQQGGKQGGMFEEEGDVAAPQGGLKGGKGIQGLPGQGKGVQGGFPGQGKGVEGGFPGMDKTEGQYDMGQYGDYSTKPTKGRGQGKSDFGNMFSDETAPTTKPVAPTLNIAPIDFSDLGESDTAGAQVQSLVTQGITPFISLLDSGKVKKSQVKGIVTKVKKVLTSKVMAQVCAGFEDSGDQESCVKDYKRLVKDLSRKGLTVEDLYTALQDFQDSLVETAGLDSADEEESTEDLEF